DRVAILEANLQALLGQREVALDRLVAVGHAAEHHELALPRRLVERLAKQLRRLRLDHDLGVEVGARTEVEILVRPPGGAVVADHAVRDEVTAAGGDVVQRSLAELLDDSDPSLDAAVDRVTLEVALAGDRRVGCMKKPEVLGEASAQAHVENRPRLSVDLL